MDLPLRYYDAMEVDIRAEPMFPVQLRFPQFALHSQTPGKVVLLLLISETGNVDRVEVLESQPRDIFNNSARAAFSMIPFTPAIRNGSPVRSRKIVEINYAPAEQ
jgi:protein TonB